MADIPTVILGLTKPDVDVEDPAKDWGDKLNENFDALDAQWESVLPEPLTLGSAGSAGTDTRVARADHVHPMGGTLPPIPGLELTGDLDMNGFDILEWLDADIPPASAGALATGGRNRIAQILSQIKAGFGLTNWYDSPTGLLIRMSAAEAEIVTLHATDVTLANNITALQGVDATHTSQIAALQATDTTHTSQIAALQTGQTTLNTIDRLRPTAQGTPGTTVAVAAGVYTKSDGSATVTFAGGNSPAFAVVTANSRIDLLTIDDTGTVAITQGTQAASPTPPAYPSTKIVLAEVTISQTTGPAITQAMIKDVRPYLNLGSGGGGSSASLEYVAYAVGTPSGTYSGSTTVFDLPFSYATNGKTIEVYYNGQQLKFSTDYSETSTTRVTMTSALVTGAAVWFRAVVSAAAVTPTVVTLYREDFIVGTALNNYTGSLTVFDLVNTFNVGGNAIMVTLDGDVQTRGATADYLETDSNTITFNTALVAGQRISFMWASSAPSSAVNSGTAGQLAYYPSTGGAVSGTPAITTDGSTVTTTLPTKLKGTTTNDDAAAGNVGEYISSSSVSQNVGTNSTFHDITSITLGAGDWDISAMAMVTRSGATFTTTDIELFVGSVAGNNVTGSLLGDNYVISNAVAPTTFLSHVITIPSIRKSLSAPTTFYLKGYCEYSAGTPHWAYRLSARRIR